MFKSSKMLLLVGLAGACLGLYKHADAGEYIETTEDPFLENTEETQINYYDLSIKGKIRYILENYGDGLSSCIIHKGDDTLDTLQCIFFNAGEHKFDIAIDPETYDSHINIGPFYLQLFEDGNVEVYSAFDKRDYEKIEEFASELADIMLNLFIKVINEKDYDFSPKDSIYALPVKDKIKYISENHGDYLVYFTGVKDNIALHSCEGSVNFHGSEFDIIFGPITYKGSITKDGFSLKFNKNGEINLKNFYNTGHELNRQIKQSGHSLSNGILNLVIQNFMYETVPDDALDLDFIDCEMKKLYLLFIHLTPLINK